MKFISSKLKKLGYFDYVIILVVIFGASFFAYFFFRKSTYINAVIKVNEDSVKYETWRLATGTRSWFEQYFYKGMKETSGLKKTMAEVESVYSYDIGPDRKSLYLNVKLNAVYNSASGQYTFKGKPLIVGSVIKLNLDKAYVEGLVSYVEGLEDKREKVRLSVDTQLVEYNTVYEESEGVKNSLADSIKVGDEVYDSLENPIIKITSKSETAAKRLVETSDGRTIVSSNPLRKDVYLTLEVNAYKLGGKYFLFDDVPILVGEKIPINTSYYSILPEVTNIEEIK